MPARELEMFNSLRSEAHISFQSRFGAGPPPIATALLVGVQLRIWWWCQLPDVRHSVSEAMVNFGPPIFEQREVWRLLSSGLLQVELFHLVLNMMWMFYVGWNLERALGAANMVLIFTLSVMGGGLLSVFGSPAFGSLGASGGVFGLIAAAVVFGLLRPQLLPERGRRMFGFALAPYLALMFFSGLSNPQTDNLAHLGGLITGALLIPLLDPPDLQRRRHWNRTVQLAAYSALGATLGTLAVLGPAALPLQDSQLLGARRGAKVRAPTADAAQWLAPAGWSRGYNTLGDLAATSPVSARSFSVRQRTSDRPTTAQDLRDAVIARLQSTYADLTVVEETETALAGRPAQRVHLAGVDGEQRRFITWVGAAQGIWTLEAMWEDSSESSASLSYLRDRLERGIHWPEPAPLAAARASIAHTPNAFVARLDVARTLGMSGDAAAALDDWRALLDERPNDPTVRAGLLQLLAWFPDVAPDLDDLLDRLLANGSPTDTTSVVEVLEASGRVDLARGLLEAAWWRSPGDRRLRSARAGRRMSTNLPLDVTPWRATHVGSTDEPLAPQAVAERTGGPLSLRVAHGARDELLADEWRATQALQAALATPEDDLTARDDALIEAVWRLAHGEPLALTAPTALGTRVRWDQRRVNGLQDLRVVLAGAAAADKRGWMAEVTPEIAAALDAAIARTLPLDEPPPPTDAAR